MVAPSSFRVQEYSVPGISLNPFPSATTLEPTKIPTDHDSDLIPGIEAL